MKLMKYRSGRRSPFIRGACKVLTKQVTPKSYVRCVFRDSYSWRSTYSMLRAEHFNITHIMHLLHDFTWETPLTGQSKNHESSNSHVKYSPWQHELPCNQLISWKPKGGRKAAWINTTILLALADACTVCRYTRVPANGGGTWLVPNNEELARKSTAYLTKSPDHNNVLIKTPL